MAHPLFRPRIESLIGSVLNTEHLSLEERTSLRAAVRVRLMDLTRAKDVDAVEKALAFGYLQALSYDKGDFIQARYHDQACTAINRYMFHLTNNVRGDSTDLKRCLTAFRDQLVIHREHNAIEMEEARLNVMKARNLRGLDAQTEKVRRMYDAAERRIPFLQEQLKTGFVDGAGRRGLEMLQANAVAAAGEGPGAALAMLMVDLSIKGDSEQAVADSLAAELATMAI